MHILQIEGGAIMLKTTIKLSISRNSNKITCYDLATLGLILGTKGIAGNLNLYGVKHKNGRYSVKTSAIKSRIKMLEKRKHQLEEYLRVMRQVVG